MPLNSERSLIRGLVLALSLVVEVGEEASRIVAVKAVLAWSHLRSLREV